MPTEIFNQLKTLREGIAESLRKDPRYLTLHALDKSIAEIAGVLSASGLMTADAAASPPPFSVEPGKMQPVGGTEPPQAGTSHERAPISGPSAPASTGAPADPHAELLGKPIGTTASKSTKPVEEAEGESDEEPEPAGSLPEHGSEPGPDTREPIAADFAHPDDAAAERPPQPEPTPDAQGHGHADAGHPAETQPPIEAPVASEPLVTEAVPHADGPHHDTTPAPPEGLEHDEAHDRRPRGPAGIRAGP